MYLCWFVHLCQEGHIAPDGRIYEKFGMFLKYGDGHIAKVNWVLAFGYPPDKNMQSYGTGPNQSTVYVDEKRETVVIIYQILWTKP